MSGTPRVVVATPSFNAAATIDEAVMSVVSQRGDFHLRYHVQDGGSADGTVKRLQDWEALLRQEVLPVGTRSLEFSYATARDGGMYDALNRAFTATGPGDVMAWINADDRLQPGAVQAALDIFALSQETMWLGGRHNYCDARGTPIGMLGLHVFSRELLELGLYEGRRLFFLQQEGTFWRGSLWLSAGGKLDSNLRYAGDFELWRRFGERSEFVSVDSALGAFRVRPGQATSSLDAYYAEIDRIVAPFAARREAVWDSLRRGDPDSLGHAGPVACYDWTERRWRIERRPATLPSAGSARPWQRARRGLGGLIRAARALRSQR